MIPRLPVAITLVAVALAMSVATTLGLGRFAAFRIGSPRLSAYQAATDPAVAQRLLEMARQCGYSEGFDPMRFRAQGIDDFIGRSVARWTSLESGPPGTVTDILVTEVRFPFPGYICVEHCTRVNFGDIRNALEPVTPPESPTDGKLMPLWRGMVLNGVVWFAAWGAVLLVGLAFLRLGLGASPRHSSESPA